MNPPSSPSHDCPAVDDLAALRTAVTGLAREVEGLRRSLAGTASAAELARVADLVTDLSQIMNATGDAGRPAAVVAGPARRRRRRGHAAVRSGRLARPGLPPLQRRRPRAAGVLAVAPRRRRGAALAAARLASTPTSPVRRRSARPATGTTGSAPASPAGSPTTPGPAHWKATCPTGPSAHHRCRWPTPPSRSPPGGAATGPSPARPPPTTSCRPPRPAARHARVSGGRAMSQGQIVSGLIAAAGVALLVLALAREAPSRVARVKARGAGRLSSTRS